MTDAPIQQRPGPGPTGPITDQPTDEQSGTVATAAKETKAHAGQLAHDAAGELRGVADTAKDQARSLASGARRQLATEADGMTNRAADALRTTAQDLDAMVSGQGAPPDSPTADVVRQIGQRVERVADQLRERGYQGAMDDVSRWARAHPGAFLLAAAGAGFALGRIVRSVDTGAVMDAAREGAGMDTGDSGDMGTAGMEMPPMVAPELTTADVPPMAEGQVGAMTAGIGDPEGLAPSTAVQPAQIDLTDDPVWQEPTSPTAGSTGGPGSEGRP